MLAATRRRWTAGQQLVMWLNLRLYPARLQRHPGIRFWEADRIREALSRNQFFSPSRFGLFGASNVEVGIVLVEFSISWGRSWLFWVHCYYCVTLLSRFPNENLNISYPPTCLSLQIGLLISVSLFLCPFFWFPTPAVVILWSRWRQKEFFCFLEP